MIIITLNNNMDKVKMLGAIVGDIIGSTYEFYNTKSMDFELFEQGCRFTDDSVMTLAVAKWLTEDEAHRYISKLAMQQKRQKREIAESIIRTYSQ